MLHPSNPEKRALIERPYNLTFRISGFSQCGASDSWEISSAWEVFSASADIWHATYVNFTIYFDKDLLAAVKSTAAQNSTQPDVLRTKIRNQLLDFQLKMVERLRSQAK